MINEVNMNELVVEAGFPKALNSPMLIQFQTGYLDNNFSSNSDSLLVENNKKKCRGALLDIDDTVYFGDENNDPFQKTLILARNKNTGKVRLIEVGTCLVRATIGEDIQVGVQKEVNALEVSRKFGSKRDKKRMEQKARLNVTTTIINEQMKSVEEADTTVKIDVSSFNKSNIEDAYIPPINREAMEIKDVYSIDDILNEEQIDSIKNEIDSKEYTEELTPYMKTFIASNFIGKESKLSAIDVALILYVNSLLKIYSETAKEIVKKVYRVCSCSVTIHELVLNNFTLLVNGKRTRPNQMKDKALCFALIILLILNDFKVQLEPLSQALKLTPTSVSNKAKIIGASTVTNDGKKFLQLKLPLVSGKAALSRRKSAKF